MLHTSTRPELVTIRAPHAEDATPIWRLLPEIGTLERNSPYAYLLLCTHFAGTSVVAEDPRGVAGFLLGYRPPADPASLFVWQIGVSPRARGQGLAGRMLDELLVRPASAAARFLTATVEPDNAASRALFRGFARRHGVPFTTRRGFPSELFPAAHADEDLIKIGPLPGQA